MEILGARAHIWRVTWNIPHAGWILFYPIISISLSMLCFMLRMTNFFVGFCSTFDSLSYALVEKACQSQCSLKSHLTEDFGVMGSYSDYYLLQLWKILWFIFNVWHQNWLPIVITPKLLFILAQLFWEALKYSFKSWAAECPGVLFSISMESCGPLLAFLVFADGDGSFLWLSIYLKLEKADVISRVLFPNQIYHSFTIKN